MAGRIEFGFNFNSQTQGLKQSQFGLKRIYIFGDFSAHSRRIVSEKKIITIDIDNFDQVLSKIQPIIDISPEWQLNFSELEDFHPDNIYQNGAVFKNLRRLKKELETPQRAQKVADEIREMYQNAPKNIQVEYEGNQEDETDLIKRLLGRRPSDSVKNIESVNKFDTYLHNLFKPHLVADTTPEIKQLINFINLATEEMMNSILHSSAFQEIESIWRSTYDLLFNEEIDENQIFYLVDISKQELFDDFNTNGLMDSAIAKKLIDHGIQQFDQRPYILMVGNYTFSTSTDDIEFLSLIGEFSGNFNSSFVSAVDKTLIENCFVDEQSCNQAWEKFKRSKASEWVVLTYPRILLRIPYGMEFEEIESFPFEEFREAHEHEHLLWGNSAFACARLLLRQHLNPQLGDNYELSDLPAYTYNQEDEKVLQACAEEFMNEQQIIKIAAQGILPFISFRNRNSVRLKRIQSVSTRSI